MALKRCRTLRWTVPLAKVVLLQSVAMSSSHAIELNDVAASDNAVIDAATERDNARLAQLNLNSDSSDSNADNGSDSNSDSNSDNDSDNIDSLDLYLDVTLNGASVGLTHFYYRDDNCGPVRPFCNSLALSYRPTAARQ